MVLAFLLIYFGVRSYRDNVAGGTANFGRAFKVASLISAVSAILLCCDPGKWSRTDKLLPDFMTKYSAHILETGPRRMARPKPRLASSVKADMEKYVRVRTQNPGSSMSWSRSSSDRRLAFSRSSIPLSAGVLEPRRRERGVGGRSAGIVALVFRTP